MKIICWITFVVLLAFNWAGTQHLPKIKLKDLNNKRQELSQYYSDGPVLINFWNLACEPCKREMKELDKLNIKYGDQGFAVLSINTDGTRQMALVKSYVRSQEYTFPVLLDPRGREFFKKMGGNVMPFVIIADSTGEIKNRHESYTDGDEKELEKEILQLLVKQQPPSDTLQIDPAPPKPEKSLDPPSESTTE